MLRDEEWLLNEKYQGERTEEFFVDCGRLKAGEPLAYVIGHVPFLDTIIYLDQPAGQTNSRPLIPRVETEFWVNDIIENVFPNFRGLTPKITILDLCAGSGCIGVAVLKALPVSHVDFAEVDVGHHSTIIRNIRENDISLTRARIFGGDLFEHVTGTYDFILANPPYIDKKLSRTEMSVLEHEPHNALFADNAGFAVIERIVRGAPHHLTSNGTLGIEHEPEHADQIHVLGTECGFRTETRTDQYGVLRYTLLTRE